MTGAHSPKILLFTIAWFYNVFHIALHLIRNRSFVNDKWCIWGLSQAIERVIEGKLSFNGIIMVLLENGVLQAMPRNFDTYIQSLKHIQAWNWQTQYKQIHMQIQFRMPRTPLQQLRVRINVIYERKLCPLKEKLTYFWL